MKLDQVYCPLCFLSNRQLQSFGHLIWRTDSFEKTADAGKDWRREEKGRTEDEMVGWHHQLNGHEFEWTPGVGDGQGGLACCRPWGRKESDTTEQLNWTNRWLSCKESSCQCRRLRRHGFDSWVGKIPGGGNGNAFQYSCWDNPEDRGVWRAIVHGVAKS